MCNLEFWHYSCGHAENKTFGRHLGDCEDISTLIADIEYPCEACREEEQINVVKRWQKERQCYLDQSDELQRKGRSTESAKNNLSDLHCRTLRALQELHIDDLYRGLTFRERSTLRKVQIELAVKKFLSKKLGMRYWTSGK